MTKQVLNQISFRSNVKMEVTSKYFKHPEVVYLKQRLNLDQNALQDSFDRLEKVLDEELPKLGPESIPQVNFQDLQKSNGKFNDDIIAKLKKSGVIIIRNVFSKDQAELWNQGLIDYFELNGLDPNDKKTNMFESYWSKPQVEARHHPNMILLQKALMNLWSKNPGLDDCVDLTQPLTYNDRLRMRKPDQKSSLAAHMDSGTLSRWADPISSKETFKSIFQGKWEEYDPFCVNGRGVTLLDEHCSFFRAFQGWLSLSEAGPGDGTLKVLPLLKEALVHALIRPLLKDIPEDELPNYYPHKILYLDQQLHARLINAMISVPKVYPGDCVFWHGDLLHSVEDEHFGQDVNTVMYIPAGPECPLNRLYVERAKNCFENGLSPPDFHMNRKANMEKDFKDRATVEDLNEDALVMMGFKSM